MTTAQVVARFLTTQSLSVGPAAHVAESWRAFAQELGMPCPEALVLLAQAGSPLVIRYRGSEIDNPWFELESPDQARERRTWNLEHVQSAGMPAPYATLLPFASADGDQLLIDAEGAIHAVPFAIYARAGRIADSVEDLLIRVMAQPIEDDELEA